LQPVTSRYGRTGAVCAPPCFAFSAEGLLFALLSGGASSWPPSRKRARLGWWPACEFTMGNHEDHIRRAVNEDPKLEGLMSDDDLGLADYGWRVHEFLQPISIGGVAFCHYFPSGVMGKPISSAPALLRKLHMSAFAGHLQGREIAYARRADGGNLTAIISGSFYQHTYKYLSPFLYGMMVMAFLFQKNTRPQNLPSQTHCPVCSKMMVPTELTSTNSKDGIMPVCAKCWKPPSVRSERLIHLPCFTLKS
jgi:hypothetical protein